MESTPDPTGIKPSETVTAKLHRIFTEEWEWAMREYPTWASSLGDRRYNDRWSDSRPKTFTARKEHQIQVIRTLAELDVSQLSEADRLNHELFLHQYRVDVEELDFDWHLIPINQRGGIQTLDELADSLRFEVKKDYEDWISRLEKLGTLMDQTIELLQAGVDKKVLLPKIVMERVPVQIDKQIVEDPEKSPFYKPFHQPDARLDTAVTDALKSRARKAIQEVVVPAFRRLKAFVDETYLPSCFDRVGVWQIPRGTEAYAFFARKFTTTTMSPDEIHEVGLKEVDRIRQDMTRIKDTLEERGEFKGSLEQFFEYLRTDKKFYYDDPKTLLNGYMALAKKIDPLMVKVFKVHPRMPYGIEPVPDNIAPDTTTAYYRRPAADGSRAGTYFVNLYKPEVRKTFEMVALGLHEAVPGHHTQIALAMEQGEQPAFRRNLGFTAFIEGWGLYAESLGEELGLYKDLYDKFGQLSFEMWRAVRLVVDTGMHHKMWTRDQAIEFFILNAPRPRLDVINEVDRYISWPGQALAYKIGELTLQRLRRKAADALGDRFDVRDFHDLLMHNGAVPLHTVERQVEEWIRDQTAIQQKPTDKALEN